MEKEKQSIQIDIKRTVPLFADNVLVANMIKAEGKKKDGYLTLVFIDSLTKGAVSRIVISKQTAEAVLKVLADSLKKFDKEMKIKEKSKQSKIETTEKTKGYLG